MSEPHEKSQNLTVEQLNSIDLLVQGLSDREVAEKVGVARETVTRWRNGNAFFQAQLNQRRQEIWFSSHEKLRSLVGEAVEVLATELKAGDLRAAIEVLKAVGLYGKVEPPEAITDPDVILVKQAKLWAQQEIAKELPSADPLKDFLDKDAKIARLAQKRLSELRASEAV